MQNLVLYRIYVLESLEWKQMPVKSVFALFDSINCFISLLCNKNIKIIMIAIRLW